MFRGMHELRNGAKAHARGMRAKIGIPLSAKMQSKDVQAGPKTRIKPSADAGFLFCFVLNRLFQKWYRRKAEEGEKP